MIYDKLVQWTFPAKDKETGQYLRPHSEKNLKQHQAFLDAFKGDEKAYQEVIDWFKSLYSSSSSTLISSKYSSIEVSPIIVW